MLIKYSGKYIEIYFKLKITFWCLPALEVKINEVYCAHTVRMPFGTQSVGSRRFKSSLQLALTLFTILICRLSYTEQISD